MGMSSIGWVKLAVWVGERELGRRSSGVMGMRSMVWDSLRDEQ